jgi:16S rRNA (uracil1498-N3)-methyltransferase
VTQDPHVLLPGALEGAQEGGVVPLEAAAERHLRKVLRRPDGATLSVTDGRGGHAAAELVAGGARLLTSPARAAEPSPRLVLAQALSKGRRAEDAVRMTCELGVERIVPVVADRTQGRPDADAADAVVSRWQAIAAAALEQSRAVRLARIDRPVDVESLVSTARSAGALRLVAVPGSRPLPELLTGPHLPSVEVVVAIGPEGGWTTAELERFLAAGWVAVGLGSTVLRTEHAGPVAVAVIAAMIGRWHVDGLPGPLPAGG